MNIYLTLALILCVIVIARLLKAKRQAEKNFDDLLRKNNELKKFQGYREEVAKLRDEITTNLPETIKTMASLWVDLNDYLGILEADYRYHGRDRMRARVWHSPEVQALRRELSEKKEFQYKIELLENKCAYVTKILIEKYSETIDIDDDFINKKIKEDTRLSYEIASKRSKLWTLEEEIERVKDRLQKLRELCDSKNKELNDINSLIADYRKRENKLIREEEDKIYRRIQEAKERLKEENDTPKVLEKIAGAWADYKELIWDKAIAYLLVKQRPISFERAEDFRRSLRQYKEEVFIKYKEYQYKYDYLISLFPELQEYIDGEAIRADVEEVKEEYEDRRIGYLSREEWESLSDREKSQRALDNYNEARRRTKSQVGRDYEEYIAHLFRQKLKGCDITMFGEQKGLADLGRDLIVKHKSKVYIVQCKRWSEDKIIHEKHIMQLFGTTIEYCWDMKSKGVSPLEIVGKSVIPVFVTTTELSPTATKFAERLGVVICKQAIGDYPQIKCNIGKDGEMIYHLPFDQQYNSTIIEHNKGEFYAWDVEQAEKAGYRRAMKYYYN